MAPEHQALKPPLQGKGRKSTIKKEHLADASVKDRIWPAESVPRAGLPRWCWERAWLPEAWSHPGLYLTANVHSRSQTWEVHPSPSGSAELKPPLGGYFSPKLEVPHREDTWVCEPLERCDILSQACFLQDPAVKQMGRKVVEVSFCQCLFNVFRSKEGGVERKAGFEYPLLRKMAWVEHLPQRDLPL